jgi:excisionase family DNA binding protein
MKAQAMNHTHLTNDPAVQPIEPATMTADETAAVLGLARGSVYGAFERDEIPHERVGRRILVSPARIAERFNIPLDTVSALLTKLRTDDA